MNHTRWIVRVGDKYLDADSHPTVSHRDRAFAFSNIRANAAANLWIDACVEPQEAYKVDGSRGPLLKGTNVMAWKLLTPPLTLVQGDMYSALLHIPWYEKALATPGAIEAKLESAGFTSVTVDPNGDGGPRASGTWGQATQDNVSLPSEIVSVWELEPDAPTTPAA